MVPMNFTTYFTPAGDGMLSKVTVQLNGQDVIDLPSAYGEVPYGWTEQEVCEEAITGAIQAAFATR